MSKDLVKTEIIQDDVKGVEADIVVFDIIAPWTVALYFNILTKMKVFYRE
jgi:hypothetical protein